MTKWTFRRTQSRRRRRKDIYHGVHGGTEQYRVHPPSQESFGEAGRIYGIKNEVLCNIDIEIEIGVEVQ